MKIKNAARNVAAVTRWNRPRLVLEVERYTTSPTKPHFLHEGAATS